MRLATLLTASALLALAAAGPKGEPSPVLVWPAGPLEVRAAFARPIDPAILEEMTGRTIDFAARGAGAKSGQGARGKLRIAGARLADGGRTLILATDPHPFPTGYAFALPGTDPSRVAEVPAYDLSGVEATWDDGRDDATPAWIGWWPHLDTKRARERADGSAEHRREFEDLARPGRLTLRSLVALPEGKGTVTLRANAPFEATLGSEQAATEGETRADLAFESNGEPVELAVILKTGEGGKPSSLSLSYRMGDGPERPVPDAWLTVPWAPGPPPASPEATKPPYDLSGGDPARGERVFFGEEAKCSTCHKVGGQGGEVGPDLGGLAGKDPAEVYRAIADPSAEIHPEYVPYTVITRDGGVAVGVVRAEGADAIRVLDNAAKATTIPKADIDQLRPSGTSIMPVGLAGALGERRMRDLIAYLIKPLKKE